VQIHPTVNQTISPGGTQVQVVWGTTDYNVGTLGLFTVSSAGIVCPAVTGGAMLLTAQIGLGALGDPTPDPNARIRFTIKTLAGIVVGESWMQQDSQNNNPDGVRVQVSAIINNPSASDTYVVSVYFGANASGTLLAANSWFAAVILP
jgi:hypothetical protein